MVLLLVENGWINVKFYLCLLSTETKWSRFKDGVGVHEVVKKPKIICDYNNNMAGVNKADQLMVYYACG